MNEEIVIPIAFFATITLIVYIVLKFMGKEKQQRYALIEKAIEHGLQIPENLLVDSKKPEKRSFEYFKNGIIFSFLSLALWVMYFVRCNSGADSDQLFGFLFVAAFFSAFGLAWLLIGWLRKNQEKNEQL